MRVEESCNHLVSCSRGPVARSPDEARHGEALLCHWGAGGKWCSAALLMMSLVELICLVVVAEGVTTLSKSVSRCVACGGGQGARIQVDAPDRRMRKRANKSISHRAKDNQVTPHPPFCGRQDKPRFPMGRQAHIYRGVNPLDRIKRTLGSVCNSVRRLPRPHREVSSSSTYVRTEVWFPASLGPSLLYRGP